MPAAAVIPAQRSMFRIVVVKKFVDGVEGIGEGCVIVFLMIIHPLVVPLH